MTRIVFIVVALLMTATCLRALDLPNPAIVAAAPIESESSEEGADETFPELATPSPQVSLSMIAFDQPSTWPARELCAPSPILDPLVDPPRA